ncbi:hypothetical protein NGM36_36305, partial [Streptomyces mutabilis]|uniref:hypothetical protein n=1 Tax=Streptomyces mutabilis TaxID=67332 RepID=UPI0022BA616E
MAVFFDSLRIKWEYEPQGYAVGPDGRRRPYLPDFWLPKERLWVEVKGAEEQMDVELLVYAAIRHFGLPNPAGPCWVNDHQARLLILGPIPLVEAVHEAGELAGYVHPTHALLSFRKGDVFEGRTVFNSHGIELLPEGGLVGNDGPDVFWHTAAFAADAVGAAAWSSRPTDAQVEGFLGTSERLMEQWTTSMWRCMLP